MDVEKRVNLLLYNFDDPPPGVNIQKQSSGEEVHTL
jgi:hypothetical protein